MTKTAAVSRPILAFALGAGMLLAGCATTKIPPAAGPVTLQILAINDFHGNLDAPRTGVTAADPADPAKTIQVEAGGAARLATLVGELRAKNPNTIMVSAGDLIGASPLLSSLFQDEPTIESLSQMGLALSAVGNHEFDEGEDELKRMQYGGCHPTIGCKGGHEFKGAGYTYLSASTIEKSTGKTVFPSYVIRDFGGVKVGFIGLSLEGVPDLISPSVAAQLEFRDEAETVNALVPKVRAEGAEAIVVLIHEGGMRGSGNGPCPNLSGPITEIVPKLDKAVDLVVSGHTHQAYVCRIDGRLVTSGGRYGQQMTKITLTLDSGSRDVTAAEAENLIVRTDAYAENKAQLALIGGYRTLADPLIKRPVGRITATIPGRKAPSGESVLGDVVADGMFAAALKAGDAPDVAFINPGGLRGDIEYANGGQVTFSDVFTVQPFNDSLVVLTMTGGQLETLLNQQFAGAEPMILQVSNGFAYAWRKDAAGKGQVAPGSITVGGKPLDPAARYRVVTNGFLANGGDGFPAFKLGTDPKGAGPAVDALEGWIAANSPLAPAVNQRIRLVP